MQSALEEKHLLVVLGQLVLENAIVEAAEGAVEFIADVEDAGEGRTGIDTVGKIGELGENAGHIEAVMGLCQKFNIYKKQKM